MYIFHKSSNRLYTRSCLENEMPWFVEERIWKVHTLNDGDMVTAYRYDGNGRCTALRIIERPEDVSFLYSVAVNVGYRTQDLSKYELSIYRIERVFPSVPWHPRVLYADTERQLRCVYQMSKSCIMTINSLFCLSISYQTPFSFDIQYYTRLLMVCFVYRYRIELHSRSISNTTQL